MPWKHKYTHTQHSHTQVLFIKGSHSTGYVHVTDHLSDTVFYESRLLDTNLSSVVSPSHFRLETISNTHFANTHTQIYVVNISVFPQAPFSCQSTKNIIGFLKSSDSTACTNLKGVCVCLSVHVRVPVQTHLYGSHL